MSVKRLIGAALLCSVFFVSCHKEPDGMLLLAEGFGGGKAAVQGNASYWVDGETVRINNADYRVNVSDGNAYASDVTTADDYYALYPNTLNPSATFADGNVTVAIPSVYMYDKDDRGMQKLDVPMAAYGRNGNKLEFKHLTAAVTVWVVNNFGIDILVDTIAVTSPNYQLSGNRNITLGSTIAVEACTTATAADRSVEVRCTGGTPLKINCGDSVAVQVPVLPVGADNKFSITVKTHNANDPAMRYKFERKQNTGGALARAQIGYAPARFGGVFSVSPTKKVHIAPGNLQYLCTTPAVWRFAQHQKDVAPFDGSYYSQTSGQYIDLFSFATSGKLSMQAYSINNNSSNFNAPVDDISGTDYDWGHRNSIANGGNEAGIWRTLKDSEWAYLISGRGSDKYGVGKMGSVYGAIILPDSYQQPSGVPFVSGKLYNSNNSYSTSQWAKMEAAGAIFLPICGKRSQRTQTNTSIGFYWSSTKVDGNTAKYFQFTQSDTARTAAYLYEGLCVRLVRDAK